jgi:hypothetical protein
MALNVEPGSNGSVTTRLRQASDERTSRNAFGLNVGRTAIARMSPVRGSITTAIAPERGVDLALGDVLDRAVDRQHHALAGLGLLEHVLLGDFAAKRVAAGDRLARDACQIRVEGALDTLQPTLGALEAEHVRRQLAVGVETQRLGQEAEPGLAQCLHLLGDRRRQLAAQPDERARAGQRGVNLGLGLTQDGRQARGHAHRVADAARLHEERLRRGRGGQRPALAVDDRAARGVEHDGARVLALGDLRQLTVLDHHQPAQTRGQAAEGDCQNGRQQQDSRPDGRIFHGAGGLVARSDAARLRSAAKPVPPVTYSLASLI